MSLALHVGLAVALFVSFSKKIDLPLDSTPIVPVDLVTIADQTNITPAAKPVENTPPPTPQDMAPPAPPDLAPPKLELAPDVKPTPKPKEKPKEAEKTFDINDIQKLLAKKTPTKVAARNVQGVGAQTAMTADLASLLVSQIYHCWSPPTGTPHPERLIVKYEVFLNRDGTVAQPPQLAPESASAASSDPYMAAAAGAARRAIYTCSPYKLPPDKYAMWRDFIVNFDPRQLEQ
jgi:outer membrane biosynthesis protein TonB